MRTIEPLAEGESVLRLTHTFDAPPEKIFTLWSEERHVRNWWGPEHCRLSHCEMDFREGGAWRFCMHSEAHATDHWIRGVYREIRAPERLSFTYINEADGHEMLVTLDFSAEGEKTVMRFRQEKFVDAAERDGHGRGWMSTFGLLADYVRRDGNPT